MPKARCTRRARRRLAQAPNNSPASAAMAITRIVVAQPLLSATGGRPVISAMTPRAIISATRMAPRVTAPWARISLWRRLILEGLALLCMGGSCRRSISRFVYILAEPDGFVIGLTTEIAVVLGYSLLGAWLPSDHGVVDDDQDDLHSSDQHELEQEALF